MINFLRYMLLLLSIIVTTISFVGADPPSIPFEATCDNERNLNVIERKLVTDALEKAVAEILLEDILCINFGMAKCFDRFERDRRRAEAEKKAVEDGANDHHRDLRLCRGYDCSQILRTDRRRGRERSLLRRLHVTVQDLEDISDIATDELVDEGTDIQVELVGFDNVTVCEDLSFSY